MGNNTSNDPLITGFPFILSVKLKTYIILVLFYPSDCQVVIKMWSAIVQILAQL
jgi:hypothetical protein